MSTEKQSFGEQVAERIFGTGSLARNWISPSEIDRITEHATEIINEALAEHPCPRCAAREEYAPSGYDPDTDDMTIPFALELAEAAAKLERKDARIATLSVRIKETQEKLRELAIRLKQASELFFKASESDGISFSATNYFEGEVAGLAEARKILRELGLVPEEGE